MRNAQTVAETTIKNRPMSDFVILNVDDTDATRYAKSRILSRAGFTIIEASNGADAIAMANEQQPNLILLDTRLPDINGFEVCRRLKSDPATSSIAILQTSASFISLVDKINGIECGADNYLFEPIEPEELIVNITALLRLGLAEQEVREVDRRKDIFLATLAHELRNPLGPIRNSVKLLKTLDTRRSAKELELLDIISRQTDQMVKLVDDLLDVSRISQGKISLDMETLNVREVVEVATESTGNLITDRGHQLTVNIFAEPMWVKGDKVRLTQIISNLLTNAAKFTPSGGHIVVDVLQEEAKVLIKVSDNGIGLDDDHLHNIFDLFVQHAHTEDRAQEGLGIGLSLVKNLANLHGGEIYVASAGANQGSTFTLELKLVEAPQHVSDPVETKQTVSENTKVLVIDDNEDAASTLSDLLELAGNEVRTAHTGKQGLAVATDFQPRIIFLDIGLPDMTGYEVAKAMRKTKQLNKCFLIALTGYGTEADRQMALDAGFDLHLTKPLDYEKIESINLGL
jgi:DNA-binding response OmpR family regulator/anti-sigma regulatory factor (Ser/Thr protein kinase)